MWFWNGLSGVWNWLLSGLARADAFIRGTVAQQPATVALIAIIAVVVAIFGYREWPEFRYWLQRAEPGQIIVNSPTVYTRQRLVNDRLDQTRWLNDQLKLADNPKAGGDTKEGDRKEKAFEFRIVDNVQRQLSLNSIRLGIGTSADQKGGSADPKGGNADQPTVQELFSVDPTTAAMFRAKNAYREEVRGEITQTQLDDRHDIKGNTIYRVSFDATVIAGSRPDIVAGIKVTLGHYPYADGPPPKGMATTQLFGGITLAERARKDTLAWLYSQDYEELYAEWMQHMRRTIYDSLDNLTQLLLEKEPDPNSRLLIRRFLTGRLCELITLDRPNEPTTSDQPKYKTLDPSCDPQFEVTADAADRRGVANELTKRYFADRLYDAQLQTRDETKAQIEGFYETLKIPIGEADGILRRIEKSIESYCKIYPYPTVFLPSLGFPPTFGELKPDRQKNLRVAGTVGCPVFDSPKERLIANIVLYELLVDLPPRARISDADNILRALRERRLMRCDASKKSQESESNKFCGNPDRRAATRCFAADFLRAKLDAFDRKVNPWERLSTFFDVRVVGREAEDCQIFITQRSGVRLDQLIDYLRHALNRNTETFSYSVTPKNLSENISTAAETRDSLELLAQYGQILNKDATALANRFTERSERLQGILQHPIVVGFGSGRHPPKNLKNQHGVNLEAAGVRTTSFGWLIAPRSRGKESLRQIDGQHALTSVISVPSWWRLAELQVETCWISREDLHKLQWPADEGIEICDGRDSNIDTSVIRLPGPIAELSRKLGFDPLQQPHLSNSETTRHKLMIGQKGSLVLTGGRLWRSTQVMLGTQRANKITVLPNMEGIVAEFRCVEPQFGVSVEAQPGNQNGVPDITSVNVQVWTSEGVTSPAAVELVGHPGGLACADEENGVSGPSQPAAIAPATSRPPTTPPVPSPPGG